MPHPKISLCIPVYNVEPYLSECLDSVISQTFTDFEIIIVNDASPDNSEKIIKTYQQKDSRIRYFKHEKNLGLSMARKTSLKHARGQYISFVDSDDFVAPSFLEKLYHAAVTQNADVTVCNYYSNTKNELNDYSKALIFGSPPSWFKWHLKTHGFAPAYWNKLWKRKLFDKPGITFLDIFFGEDMVVTTKLLFYAEKISVIDEGLYYYSTAKTQLVDKKKLKEETLKTLKEEHLLHKELIGFFSKHNLKKEISYFFFIRKPILTTYVRKAFICKSREIKELLIQLLKTYFSEPPYVINPIQLFLMALLIWLVEILLPKKLLVLARNLYLRNLIRRS